MKSKIIGETLDFLNEFVSKEVINEKRKLKQKLIIPNRTKDDYQFYNSSSPRKYLIQINDSDDYQDIIWEEVEIQGRSYSGYDFEGDMAVNRLFAEKRRYGRGFNNYIYVDNLYNHFIYLDSFGLSVDHKYVSNSYKHTVEVKDRLSIIIDKYFFVYIYDEANEEWIYSVKDIKNLRKIVNQRFTMIPNMDISYPGLDESPDIRYIVPTDENDDYYVNKRNGNGQWITHRGVKLHYKVNFNKAFPFMEDTYPTRGKILSIKGIGESRDMDFYLLRGILEGAIEYNSPIANSHNDAMAKLTEQLSNSEPEFPLINNVLFEKVENMVVARVFSFKLKDDSTTDALETSRIVIKEDCVEAYEKINLFEWAKITRKTLGIDETIISDLDLSIFDGTVAMYLKPIIKHMMDYDDNENIIQIIYSSSRNIIIEQLLKTIVDYDDDEIDQFTLDNTYKRIIRFLNGDGVERKVLTVINEDGKNLFSKLGINRIQFKLMLESDLLISDFLNKVKTVYDESYTLTRKYDRDNYPSSKDSFIDISKMSDEVFESYIYIYNLLGKDANSNINAEKGDIRETLANPFMPMSMIRRAYGVNATANVVKSMKNIILSYSNAPELLLKHDIETTLFDAAKMSMRLNASFEGREKPKIVRSFNFGNIEDLINLHDNLSLLYNSIEIKNNEIRYEALIKEKEAFIKKIEFSKGEYSIIYPKKSEQIVLEGLSLRHCVKSYIPSVQDGSTNIVFLRRSDELDKSLITIELKNNGLIVQARGLQNKPLREYPYEIVNFYNEWKKHISKTLKES